MLTAKRKAKTKQAIHANLEHIVTFSIAIICLVLSLAFPIADQFQNLSKDIFFLVVIPVLYIKLVLKRNMADYGWNLENKKAGLIWGVIVLATMVLVSWTYIRSDNFLSAYILPSYVISHFWLFVIYELIFVNFFLFVNEFFFRGFLLFSLWPKFKWWAVFIQAVILWASLAVTKSFTWAAIPTLTISIASGILAAKSRSFIYSWAVALLFMIIFDAYLIYSLK